MAEFVKICMKFIQKREIKMSFQLHKKLANLKDSNRKLFEMRSNVIQSKKRLLLQILQDEVKDFLKTLEFSVTAIPEQNTILANYKGQMNIEVKFSNSEEFIFGADILVNVDYLKKEFLLTVNLKRQSFQPILEEDIEQAIEQYTKLNAHLEELDTKDIDGSYKLYLKQNNLQLIPFQNIKEALKKILQIE